MDGFSSAFLSFIYNSPELAGVFFSTPNSLHTNDKKSTHFIRKKSSCPGLLWDIVIGIRSKIKRRAIMPHVGGSIINHARVTKQRKVEKPLVRISICIDTAPSNVGRRRHCRHRLAWKPLSPLFFYEFSFCIDFFPSHFLVSSTALCRRVSFLALEWGARAYQFLIIHFDDGGGGLFFHSLFSVSFSGSFFIHYISTNLCCSRCMVRYLSHFHQPK